MFTYKIMEETICEKEVGNYTTFGVCIYNDETTESIVTIHDVFLQKQKAEEFVNKCNALNLDPIHIFDVIEDTI